ncbi:hypothetical protein [Breoghania sp.]|uniref:hypothetical protein n=1 Tax=Breoghania sp. TaxID=2065378 RepID=UPI00262B4DF3|nr:hypothetical protein [Breoghania sp.]MDJ0931804.1 hypothetical protein [Breoghania sp.]
MPAGPDHAGPLPGFIICHGSDPAGSDPTGDGASGKGKSDCPFFVVHRLAMTVAEVTQISFGMRSWREVPFTAALQRIGFKHKAVAFLAHAPPSFSNGYSTERS